MSPENRSLVLASQEKSECLPTTQSEDLDHQQNKGIKMKKVHFFSFFYLNIQKGDILILAYIQGLHLWFSIVLNLCMRYVGDSFLNFSGVWACEGSAWENPSVPECLTVTLKWHILESKEEVLQNCLPY